MARREKYGVIPGSSALEDRLVGLVVKASASEVEGLGFESRLRRFFVCFFSSGRVIPVT